MRGGEGAGKSEEDFGDCLGLLAALGLDVIRLPSQGHFSHLVDTDTDTDTVIDIDTDTDTDTGFC